MDIFKLINTLELENDIYGGTELISTMGRSFEIYGVDLVKKKILNF
jgi:hypothetical protein